MPLPKPWKLPPVNVLDEAGAKALLEHVRNLVDLKTNSLDKMVDENIKKYRMSTVRLAIYDKEGNEITDAQVDVELKNHEFKFGCNAFLADDLGTEERNAKYDRAFTDVFNQAVVPFYWKDDEPEKGKWRFEKDSPYIYRRPPAEQMLDFCKRTNCEPKGHNLFWPSFEHGVPQWLGDDKAENGRLVEQRIRLLAERYADKIPVWDVINEFIGANKSLFRFPDDIDVRCFKLAEELFRDNHLIINDFQCLYHPNYYLGKKSALYLQIEKLIQAGCRVDGIGMQLHMFHNEDMLATDEPLKYTAEHMVEMVNTYSTLGKDIHFSEITFSSYDGRDTYLEMQNVIAENLYKLWFSMEKVKSIVWWNLIDGTAVKPVNGVAAFNENYFGGGLFKNDFTPKPAFNTIKNLIKKEWHTKETIATNDKGYASFTGFNGEYEVTIKKGKDVAKKNIKVTKDNPLIIIQLDK